MNNAIEHPSNDEIRNIIKDAENKMGDCHALIMSKKVMIAALKELLILRQRIKELVKKEVMRLE